MAQIGRFPSGIRTHRVFISSPVGGFTALYADNTYRFGVQARQQWAMDVAPRIPFGDLTTPVAFGDQTRGGGPLAGDRHPADASPGPAGAQPIADLWLSHIVVTNLTGEILEISFDGVNTHGRVLGNAEKYYVDRRECGIAIRVAAGGTPGGAFWIEGW